jgi:FAD/FMN-containing dehydrogenase
MDNVIAYEVVTASGRIVTGSADSEPDLFWAMKGFGSSFGIVTKFNFAAYSIPKISTTLGSFTEDMIPQFIGAATSIANYQEDYDTAAGSILTITATPSTGALNPSLIGVQADKSYISCKTQGLDS